MFSTLWHMKHLFGLLYTEHYSGLDLTISCLPYYCVLASLNDLCYVVGLSIRGATSKRNSLPWLILPVSYACSQKLSHECDSGPLVSDSTLSLCHRINKPCWRASLCLTASLAGAKDEEPCFFWRLDLTMMLPCLWFVALCARLIYVMVTDLPRIVACGMFSDLFLVREYISCGRASGAVTLKKLECSQQAYALYTLAWDNIIGFRRTTAKAFAKDVFINQERKLGARRRSDTVLVSTINDADQGSADVAYRTPLAPYEKSKFLGSGGSMVARLKLKGIDGRAPPGVEPAA
ncbi:hypothetical protein Tco_0985411 [Tanacetum coccineum]